LWNASTLQAEGTLRGHGNEVWCAAFTPDGRFLATGSKDQTVMLWSGKAEVKSQVLPLKTRSRPIFSYDGTKAILVTKSGATNETRLWDVETRKVLADLGEDNIIGFTPDGQNAVVLNKKSGCLEFFPPGAKARSRCKLEDTRPSENPFSFFGFNQDYKQFFSIGISGRVRVWNATTGKLVWTLQGPKPPIRAAELARGGNLLAISLERENSVRLYQSDGRTQMELKGHRDFVSGLAFSPDLRMLATGSMDGTIKIWNTSTGQHIFDLPGHMQEVTDVAFSQDGKTLASVALHESVKLWHLETQRELLSIEMPKAGAFIDFTGNGRHLGITTEEDSIAFLDALAAKSELPSQ
jgi:WD40 repeat protein